MLYWESTTDKELHQQNLVGTQSRQDWMAEVRLGSWNPLQLPRNRNASGFQVMNDPLISRQ